MSIPALSTTQPQPEKRSGAFKKILLVIVITIVATVVTLWLLNLYLFPKAFKPVRLTQQEEQALEAKIKRLDHLAGSYSAGAQTPTRNQNNLTVPNQTQKPANTGGPGTPLAPEPYRQNPRKRQVHFTEREINALLAHNTDLADKLAIDFSDNLASAKLLIPLDPDFPILGGKTLRVSAGLEIRYTEQNPVIKLRGVSVWGVPIPNAWLGGIKNVDLVKELGDNQGFWHAFGAGIKDIHIQKGSLFIELKE